MHPLTKRYIHPYLHLYSSYFMKTFDNGPKKNTYYSLKTPWLLKYMVERNTNLGHGEEHLSLKKLGLLFYSGPSGFNLVHGVQENCGQTHYSGSGTALKDNTVYR